MTDKLRGMVLAAGFGTRLTPLTDHLPKPLLPAHGRPLLDHALDACFAAGAEVVGVNTHHLGAQVTAHLAQHAAAARITVFPEPQILGTGGALYGAREFLATAPDFLLHNGDVLCDADLAELVAEHRRTGALATLLLVDWPAVNTVHLAPDGSVQSIAGQPATAADQAGGRDLTYSGIGIFAARLLADLGPGFSSLVPLLARALTRDSACVRGWVPAVVWNDVGTLGRYLSVVSPDDEKAAAALELRRLAGHGSDRRFWRLSAGDWSAVAMASPPADDEFDRFVAIGRFLAGAGLGTAELLLVDDDGKAALMEDLGETSLYDLATAPTTTNTDREAAYEQAVDWLLDLQANTERARRECPLAVDRSLDRAALRWESDYFRSRFVAGHCEMSGAATAELTSDFEALADCVVHQPQHLLHRDFQSQNLMFKSGECRPVDLQGLRLGPVGYDLASLVWDPYVPADESRCRRLVARYAAGAVARGLLAPEATADELTAMTLAAAAQRLMQALGAFGYLGHVKGKPHFLDHAPRALDHLQRVLAQTAEWSRSAPPAVRRWLPPPLPRLTDLVAILVYDAGHGSDTNRLDGGPDGR